MGQHTTLTIQPDLQTRESIMLAAGRAQFSVQSGNEVRYVRFDAKRKNPEGSEKRYSQVPLDEATHVFISEKGYGTTRLGTYYPPKGNYKDGRLFPNLPPDHPHMEALERVVRFVNGEATVQDDLDIEVESRCGICGRKLEDPVSVQRGIGPECAGKPTGSKILHASAFGQQQLPEPTPEDELDKPRPLASYEQAVADANHYAPMQRVEQVREEIAALKGDLHEVEQARQAITQRQREIQDAISVREGHLAELLEAAQT